MNRTLLIIFLLISAYTIQLSSAYISRKQEAAECTTCHRYIYENALASPYQHTVVLTTCTECHIKGNIDDRGRREKEEENKNVIHFSSYQTEAVLFLEGLQEDQTYEFDIVVTDKAEKNSKMHHVNIVPGMWEEHAGNIPVLTHLSGVTVDEIKKGVFVRATISWMTDVPATSEVEYRQFNRNGSWLETKDEFSRKHRITLNALAHRSRYSYKVISRDMQGNVLESEENVLDTSDETTSRSRQEEESPDGPVIEKVKTFRIKGKKGLYLEIHTNKPSRFTVSFNKMQSKETRVPGDDGNHSSGLAPARYAAIDACIECHDQNASHPVGVKAQNEKVRTPEDLPTIDGGVVTCVSCHFPHGGKKLFFARTSFSKDLCIKCHTGYY